MRLVWVCGAAIACVAGMRAVAQSPMGAMGAQQQSTGANQSIMAAIFEPTTGLPYKAVKVTKSVQMLGDGTVIRHETKGVFARDTDGRVREDFYIVHFGQVGGQETDLALQSATVGDPVSHTMLMWTDEKTKVAMKMSLPSLPALGPGKLTAGAPLSAPLPAMPALLGASAQDVRTEQLGQQSLEGVMVTGVRTTTTIPVGTIGNDRPMTVVHEEWRSPDLKILVKTIDSDPRTGEQTMELTELVRTDPDKSLFQTPAGFQVIDMADMMKTLGSLGKQK